MFRYYLAVLKKYAVFSGRARRAEYWYFVLVNFLIQIAYHVAISVAMIQIFRSVAVSMELGGGDVSMPGWLYPLWVTYMVYAFAVFIPSLAVAVRRMHDVNKSGWFIFVPFYNIILAVTDGTRGDNKYGPDPKAGTN